MLKIVHCTKFEHWCSYANTAQEYPLNEVLSGPSLIELYEPNKIKLILSSLTPENCR